MYDDQAILLTNDNQELQEMSIVDYLELVQNEEFAEIAA